MTRELYHTTHTTKHGMHSCALEGLAVTIPLIVICYLRTSWKVWTKYTTVLVDFAFAICQKSEQPTCAHTLALYFFNIEFQLLSVFYKYLSVLVVFLQWIVITSLLIQQKQLHAHYYRLAEWRNETFCPPGSNAYCGRVDKARFIWAVVFLQI